MVEVQILDYQKRIVQICFSQFVSYEELKEGMEGLQQCYKLLQFQNFHLLIDATNLSLFAPDSKYGLIQLQQQYADYVERIAFVVRNQMIFEQWSETHKRDSNLLQRFLTHEEAYHYLFSV